MKYLLLFLDIPNTNSERVESNEVTRPALVVCGPQDPESECLWEVGGRLTHETTPDRTKREEREGRGREGEPAAEGLTE